MNRQGIGLAALLFFAAGSATAQDDEHEGFYIGVGLGDYSTSIDALEDIDDVDLDLDADEDAAKLFGGWRLNRFVAVQGEYTDFGESRAARQNLDIRTDTDGITPSVVGTLPIGPIELYGKAGVMFYDVEINGPGEAFIDDSGQDAIIGTGIGFTIADTVNIRAEYERVDIDRLDDADAVWVTANWRF